MRVMEGADTAPPTPPVTGGGRSGAGSGDSMPCGGAGRGVRRGARAGDGEAMAVPRWPCRPANDSVYPGQIPALLFEAYERAEEVVDAVPWLPLGPIVGLRRRCGRAVQFADDALRLSAEGGRARDTADALDAALSLIGARMTSPSV